MQWFCKHTHTHTILHQQWWWTIQIHKVTEEFIRSIDITLGSRWIWVLKVHWLNGNHDTITCWCDWKYNWFKLDLDVEHLDHSTVLHDEQNMRMNIAETSIFSTVARELCWHRVVSVFRFFIFPNSLIFDACFFHRLCLILLLINPSAQFCVAPVLCACCVSFLWGPGCCGPAVRNFCRHQFSFKMYKIDHCNWVTLCSEVFFRMGKQKLLFAPSLFWGKCFHVNNEKGKVFSLKKKNWFDRIEPDEKQPTFVFRVVAFPWEKKFLSGFLDESFCTHDFAT